MSLYCTRFADPLYWLGYFPPRAVSDLKVLGAKASLGGGGGVRGACEHTHHAFGRIHPLPSNPALPLIHNTHLYVLSSLLLSPPLSSLPSLLLSPLSLLSFLSPFSSSLLSPLSLLSLLSLLSSLLPSTLPLLSLPSSVPSAIPAVCLECFSILVMIWKWDDLIPLLICFG